MAWARANDGDTKVGIELVGCKHVLDEIYEGLGVRWRRLWGFGRGLWRHAIRETFYIQYMPV